jgi:hypothetical protein
VLYRCVQERKLPHPVDSKSWTFLAGFCAGGKSDEEVAIHGIADRGDSEGRGSGVGGGAADQEARDQRGDLLPLEVEVRAGAGVPELKRLRELEAENAKLKRMYADLALENTAIKDVLSRKL